MEACDRLSDTYNGVDPLEVLLPDWARFRSWRAQRLCDEWLEERQAEQRSRRPRRAGGGVEDEEAEDEEEAGVGAGDTSERGTGKVVAGETEDEAKECETRGDKGNDGAFEDDAEDGKGEEEEEEEDEEDEDAAATTTAVVSAAARKLRALAEGGSQIAYGASREELADRLREAVRDLALLVSPDLDNGNGEGSERGNDDDGQAGNATHASCAAIGDNGGGAAGLVVCDGAGERRRPRRGKRKRRRGDALLVDAVRTAHSAADDVTSLAEPTMSYF